MTTEHPFHPGLTRTDTGYPAFPYHGWYWTPAEMKNIERRMRKRGHAVDEPILRGAARQVVSGPVNGTDLRTRRTCPRCSTVFMPSSPSQKYCDATCQTANQRERQKAKKGRAA